MMTKWTRKVGGLHKATAKIIERTGLRASTAEKIAEGRYPSLPGTLIREALADLVGVHHDELFPFKEKEEAS